MKRLNYFQVHKNKKPKKLKAKKITKRMLECAILAMKSFVQHSIIASHHFNLIAEKSQSMFEHIVNMAEAIANSHKTPDPMK